jgi:hypothetical protein
MVAAAAAAVEAAAAADDDDDDDEKRREAEDEAPRSGRRPGSRGENKEGLRWWNWVRSGAERLANGRRSRPARAAGGGRRRGARGSAKSDGCVDNRQVGRARLTERHSSITCERSRGWRVLPGVCVDVD